MNLPSFGQNYVILPEYNTENERQSLKNIRKIRTLGYWKGCGETVKQEERWLQGKSFM